jgi:nucleotidyltransferase substrate binding protein (TIGR01987 family)
MNGMPQALAQKLEELARGFGVQKLVLFGSRARGDNNGRSDIDLAVYGLSRRAEMRFRGELDSLDTLLHIDVVPITQDTDPALLEHIRKDGVLLMERKTSKAEKFAKALERTREALAEYELSHSGAVRDGAIQRYEFTTELAWKSCREKLIDEGYTGLDSPKATMRAAFSAGLVDDEQGWLGLLQARNITSHLYSEEQADAVFQSIRDEYIPLFGKLVHELLL